MVRFFYVTVAMMMGISCGSTRAADYAFSETEKNEQIFDVVLRHAPYLLLNHTSVCALALVNKNLHGRVEATKEIRRIVLDNAIKAQGYSIFVGDSYYAQVEPFDPSHRSLYFCAYSSFAVAIVTYNEKPLEYWSGEKSSHKQYDFGCVYAYAIDGEIKTVQINNMLMYADDRNGNRMGCTRGVPLLQMGNACYPGKTIQGPLITLNENAEVKTISFVYRPNLGVQKGTKHMHTVANRQDDISTISGVKKYIESRLRPYES